MLNTKTKLTAAAFAAACTMASPAHALFGFTCIPTLYNCMCTYRVPCPVNDPKDLAQFALENTQMQEKIGLLQDIKEPSTMMLKALNGQSPYGIPGIGSIGIDLNGIMNGNLSSLGIPSLGGDLVSQLNNLGIDGNLLSSIAAGELDVNDFLSVAQSAGLDLSVLEDIGLGIEQINALASGDLDINGVLSIADTLGIEAGVLEDIGITHDLIVGISNGDIDVGRIIDIAEHAGLDMSSLEAVGLDAATIANLPNGGPEFVARVLQNTGFDSSITTALGLDAGMIAQISSGQLDPSAIQQLVAGTGIDPSAITLPGVNGPIRVTDAPGTNILSPGGSGMGGADINNPPSEPGNWVIIGGDWVNLPDDDDVSETPYGGVGSYVTLDSIQRDNSETNTPSATENAAPNTSSTPSERPTNINDIITIPTDSVPGLQNALDTAQGHTGNAGTFAAENPELAALCAADRTLISVQMPPNAFGDDVENIHMAIAGGTLETSDEAFDVATGAGASTSADGYARSIAVRPVLLKAIEAVDTFDDMMKDAKTLQDDIIINDTINGQLMTARAETASMLTYVMSTYASSTMKDTYLTELPLFPETARFRAAIEQAARTQAQTRNQQSSIQARSSAASMAEYHQASTQAQDVIHNYNLQNNANSIASAMPGLMDTIQLHEDQKAGLFSLEQIILSSLRTLYGEDDYQDAWTILRPQLLASAASTPYTSQNKWQVGFDTSMSLSSAVTSQRQATSYGTRVLITPAERDQPPYYAMISDTPYSYSSIDTMAASQGDPYDVIPAPLPTGGRGEESPQPLGDELVGVFQYYIETARREIFYGDMRRGDVQHTMTGAFWNEMLSHAPRCLSGPIPVSAQALLDRPEMFDLDKNCDHLYWSFGDPGDYIDASHLGGADAALWISKINLDRIENITGGPQAVMADIQEVIQEISQSTAGALLEMSGNPQPAEHLDALLTALETAAQDAAFTTSVTAPGR